MDYVKALILGVILGMLFTINSKLNNDNKPGFNDGVQKVVAESFVLGWSRGYESCLKHPLKKEYSEEMKVDSTKLMKYLYENTRKK
jgi:hypothetical protein